METIIIDTLTWNLQISDCDICKVIGIGNCKECKKIYCG